MIETAILPSKGGIPVIDIQHVTKRYGALYALRHICLAEDKKLFSFTLSDSSLKDLSRVSEQYVLAHLEHKMKSLDFLKTVLE